jgi:SAM-dependent methyltransferase
MGGFDPQQYKQGQKAQWDSVAGGWVRWWRSFEEGAGHVSHRMIELAGVEPGHQVLDVATGVGEPALTVARRIGPAGRVVATDQSSGMLEYAAQRARQEGLGHVEFRLMDAEALDFGPDAFDAVLCRWGLMFLPDMDAALRRIHNSLKPGGRFSTAVWDVQEKMPAAGLPIAVLNEVMDPPPPPPPPGAPTLFKLADTRLLEEALTRTGFRDVQIERQDVVFTLNSREEYVNFLRDVAAPVVALINKAPEEQRPALWNTIADRAAKLHGLPDGGLRTVNTTILFTATR